MTTVRYATEFDTSALVRLGRAMHDESPRFRARQFDEVKALAVSRNVISSPSGCAIVAEKEGEIIGMVGAFVFEHFFGQDKIVSDYVVYVSPGHRGGTLMVRMVKLLEAWAREVGAVELSLGVSTEVEAERTVRLYEQMGYRQSGFSVLKDINHV